MYNIEQQEGIHRVWKKQHIRENIMWKFSTMYNMGRVEIIKKNTD
jgi:hypothetical protein